MRNKILLVSLPVLAILFGAAPQEQPFEWKTASPESQGFSSKGFDLARKVLEAKGTKKLLVIRNDEIIYEWYAPEDGPAKRHYTASLAKALVGGMSLLLALNDGLLFPDSPACYYIPEWKNDPLKSKITIRQLATHSSGIEDAEEDHRPHEELTGWKGAFWKREPDPFSLSRDQAPVIFAPGTRYAYSNPGMAMLAYAVTAGLKGGPYTDIRTLLRERIMEPIGVPEEEWSIGYGATYRVNDLPLVANWGGGSFSARAAARVGRLMLRKGNWEGKQLIDSKRVEKMVEYAGTPLPERPEGNPQPGSALGWYTNFDGVWERVPRDAFAGAGAGNQVLLVVPSLDLIIVRNGAALFDPERGEGFWGGIEKYVFNPILDARISPPYPSSDLITGVHFAPPESVVRKAKGSDNWPLTWADDDHLYTAYGDGTGFEPGTEIKLSLGLAVIRGFPPDFRGANLRSDGGERVGEGARGPKASGILMVDGTLYLWLRNANFKGAHSQLGWSQDRGQTWTWSAWQFRESFGYPTFVNFGKNYAGARDDYVYLYSHDDASAYQPADRMVLARVAKGRIREREAYEFFAGVDDARRPRWSADIHRRQSVFVNPGQCYRSGITYNAGLQRYLWAQTIPGEDARFKGGFGIYEAPEPWGPWRTVFYTREWDMGPGETSSFPTKWMSEDGTSAYLVFSGDDSFSVRKVTFRGLLNGRAAPPAFLFFPAHVSPLGPLRRWAECECRNAGPTAW